jgi:hypothetical protein
MSNQKVAYHSRAASNSDSKSFSKSKVSKPEETLDSQILKNNIQEFYNSSKEKLLGLKSDIHSIEKENLKEKAENIQLELERNKLKEINEALDLNLKGMKHKAVTAQKERTELKFKNRDMQDEMRAKGRIVERMKIDNNFKVQMIKNEIDHINVVKENSVKSINKKTESERAYQKELKSKISEIKDEISQYKSMLSGFLEEDSARSKMIQKETAEMTKFLSEL